MFKFSYFSPFCFENEVILRGSIWRLLVPAWIFIVSGLKDADGFKWFDKAHFAWNLKELKELITGWWFQIFYMFIPIWGRFPFWLIFFQTGWNHQPVNNDCCRLDAPSPPQKNLYNIQFEMAFLCQNRCFLVSTYDKERWVSFIRNYDMTSRVSSREIDRRQPGLMGWEMAKSNDLPKQSGHSEWW